MRKYWSEIAKNFATTVVGIGNPMKSDKGQFDEVLRRMLKEPPKKTSEIKAEKKKPKPSQK